MNDGNPITKVLIGILFGLLLLIFFILAPVFMPILEGLANMTGNVTVAAGGNLTATEDAFLTSFPVIWFLIGFFGIGFAGYWVITHGGGKE